MNIRFIISNLLIAFLAVFPVSAQRTNIDFNADWLFVESDQPNFMNPNVNDSNWDKISVPHDWAFEKGISRDGAQAANGGYFDGGVAWYRKHFKLDADILKKNVRIEFDGVYMNSEVWINGHYLGKRPYGYISFRYDLSPFLLSEDNILAVRVDNSKEPSARWYHPCGIYAPVKLVITNQQSISPNGIYVKTEINNNTAIFNIETSIENQDLRKKRSYLETSIIDLSGKVLLKNRTKIKWNAQEHKITQSMELDSPNLWSPDSPYLYTIVQKLYTKCKLVDETKTKIGIRSIEWKTESGFWLNGKQTKLKGVSEHYEGGPFGGAWTKPFLRWKLNLFKTMGVNAIRTAHNPAPPMFYDLCDELGLLVMDEIFDGWGQKAKMDYGAQAFDSWWEKDLSEWIKRNRNHPSIIIYSVGNETRGDIAPELVKLCHSLDSTRPVTSGHSASEEMDVFGVNGGSEKMSFFDNIKLTKPFVSTEAPHTWQTRGYYRTKSWFRDGYPHKRQQPFPLPDLTKDEVFSYEWAAQDKWANPKQHFNSSYDNAMVRISARKNWELMRDLPWFSGHFRWTGFDYYGEAGYVHGGWPFRLFMGGALDVAGFEKDLFYFYQSQWTQKPMVHILPHWTHPNVKEGTLIPVWVYSNCDEVELFLNGKSLGKDRPGTTWDQMQCEWFVPYEKGILEAKAYKNGELVSRTSQQTAKTPELIKLSIEHLPIENNCPVSAVITTTITDAANITYPYGENMIYYHIDGPLKITSLENGDPVDTTKNVNLLQRKAFMGLTRTFVEMDPKAQNINLTAGAILGEKQFLTSHSLSIDVQSINIRGNEPTYKTKIYYTIDGSKPTLKSTLYTGSFDVQGETTVRAIVVRGDDVILNMSEHFGTTEGLSWAPPQKKEKVREEGLMLAADASFSGAQIETKNGQKYLDFKGQEGSITWYQENDGSAGMFSLRIKYASNDAKSKRPMDLIINNKKVATLTFISKGSWNSQWAEISTNHKLSAGANYIELRTKGYSAPNILGINVE